MSTLSIIKSENKYAYFCIDEENELARMLTQCALRDEMLAEAIIQSAQHINQSRQQNQSIQLQDQ